MHANPPINVELDSCRMRSDKGREVVLHAGKTRGSVPRVFATARISVFFLTYHSEPRALAEVHSKRTG